MKDWFLKFSVSIILGSCCGIFLHYLCYRLALPAKPFIYVAF